MEHTQLHHRVYLAFQKVARPTGKEIAPHKCAECDDIAERLGSFKATEVPDSLCEWIARSMPLLSPLASLYFLPRLIEFGTINPGSQLNFDLLSFMADTRDGNYGSYNGELMYSHSQREILIEYFEFLRGLKSTDLNEVDIDKAVSFWRVEP
jgi:hypothetical protein